MDAQGPTPQIYDLSALTELLDRHYPRLLTQIDRDPQSPTYGSCDRNFWMYRLHDFDSGVLQQASLTFAALSGLAKDSDLTGCRYLNSDYQPYWSTLAEAINRRTVRLLGRSGLLDEYYPGERSFPGTVFTCYATLKSAIMLGLDEIIESPGLEAAAKVLLRRAPSPAANQDIAGAAFLSLYSHARGWRVPESSTAVQRLLAGADRNGNFLEYGGIDVGYASVTLNYLACMEADGSHPTIENFKRLAESISVFVTPSGLVGGEFASRSTTYFLPFGMIEAAYTSPVLASRFAGIDLLRSYEKLDDRYLMHYCLPSLAMAALQLARRGPPDLGEAEESATWSRLFDTNAHIYAWRRNSTVIFIGANKGGAFHIEDQGETHTDCGFRIERAGEVYATCVLDEAPEVSISEDDGQVALRIQTPFRRYGTLVASSSKTVLLRLLRFLGPTFNVRWYPKTRQLAKRESSS